MIWLKAFHVIAMVTWFAGLFYLPRLFVYHADATDAPSLERFEIMERRLFALMTIGGGGPGTQRPKNIMAPPPEPKKWVGDRQI